MLFLKQSSSFAQEVSYKTLTSGISIEFRNTNSNEGFYAIDQAITRLMASPWFTGRLPNSFGIIMDSAWSKSEGYFSPDLKTFNGAPAILFSGKLFDHDRALNLSAHELTHLMHYHLRSQSVGPSESWISEGIAMMAEWLITKEYGKPTHNPALIAAFKYPETSLIEPLNPNNEEYQNIETRTAQCGHILQYFIYIYRLCGKTKLLNALITSQSEKTGIDLMDEVLRASGSTSFACKSFHDSFINFSIARFHQGFAPEDYVYSIGIESQVREKRLPLPPYSSTAYELPIGEKCASGEFAWGNTRCIKIREN